MATATFPRPTITAAPQARVVESVQTPELDYLRIYTSSILAASAVFLFGVGAPLAIYLDSIMSGFGIGAFSAFWGGPSFGVIVGSARVAAWQERYGDDHP